MPLPIMLGTEGFLCALVSSLNCTGQENTLSPITLVNSLLVVKHLLPTSQHETERERNPVQSSSDLYNECEIKTYRAKCALKRLEWCTQSSLLIPLFWNNSSPPPPASPLL